ncbi:hypothetical protein WICPIJ_004960 [Wickerhamomyces pijperi]|uniref:Secreted protein n=1 Tax=Wickerhamomyces pijperi TaxID=599730 RepID=A0A9P8Q4G0_WICPI|nr:hypothetical protein WICPIJ_004960 [Wickerhamomyces pijperi]
MLRIVCIGISLHFVINQVLNSFSVDSWMWLRQFVQSLLVPVDQSVVDWENTGKGTPFSGHVGNGQSVINGQFVDMVTGEFNGVVQHFIVVEDTTKSDNHILTCDTFGQSTLQLNFGHWWNLPPCLSCGPDRSSIGSDNWGT